MVKKEKQLGLMTKVDKNRWVVLVIKYHPNIHDRNLLRCTQGWYYGCERTGTADIPLNPATSARLHTVDTFSFRYGTVEARVRAPVGDWLWPSKCLYVF